MDRIILKVRQEIRVINWMANVIVTQYWYELPNGNYWLVYDLVRDGEP